MALNVETAYHVTNGVLKGYVLKPHRVSRCGSYGFFYDPMDRATLKEVRIHSKHLSTKEPERTIGMVEAEDTKAMAGLHIVAHSYVSSDNIKRIAALEAELKQRTETNMAEVKAIRQGTVGNPVLLTISVQEIIMVAAVIVAVLALVL